MTKSKFKVVVLTGMLYFLFFSTGQALAAQGYVLNYASTEPGWENLNGISETLEYRVQADQITRIEANISAYVGGSYYGSNATMTARSTYIKTSTPVKYSCSTANFYTLGKANYKDGTSHSDTDSVSYYNCV